MVERDTKPAAALVRDYGEEDREVEVFHKLYDTVTFQRGLGDSGRRIQITEHVASTARYGSGASIPSYGTGLATSASPRPVPTTSVTRSGTHNHGPHGRLTRSKNRGRPEKVGPTAAQGTSSIKNYPLPPTPNL